MTRALLLGSTLLIYGVCNGADRAWSKTSDGIEVMQTTATTAKGTVHIALIRIQEQRGLRVVDVLKAVRKETQSPAYSLNEVAKYSSEKIFLSGGSGYSFDFPMPLGLLVTERRVVTPVAKSRALSGFLCVSHKEVKIALISTYSAGLCEEALQAGPMIVENGGKPGIVAKELALPPAERAVLALDKSKNLLLIFADQINLYDLMQFLLNPQSNLQIDVALNLNGSTEAGLIVKGSPNLLFGNVNALIPSAIAIR